MIEKSEIIHLEHVSNGFVLKIKNHYEGGETETETKVFEYPPSTCYTGNNQENIAKAFTCLCFELAEVLGVNYVNFNEEQDEENDN